MDSEKYCELWKNLVTIYQQLKGGCCCSENEVEIKKAIQSSLEPADYSNGNQLRVCLLGLSTINLLGKMTWQQNHQEMCTKLEWLSKNVVSTDIIRKLVGILLKCHNKHIIYSIRKSFVAFLFNYPKEISTEAENHTLTFLIQLTSDEKINYDVLEMLRDIVLFQRPQAQSLYSSSIFEFVSSCKSHHKYDIEDRTNEIKAKYANAGIHIWNDLSFCLKDKSPNDELQFLVLDIWSSLIVTALQLQLSIKDIIIKRFWEKILDVSCQSSSSICAKVFVVLNQVLSLNYFQVTRTPPLEIIHLSEDIVTMTKNGWLGKISLKTRHNNFIGEQASKNSGTEKVCLIQLRNIVLINLKCLSIVIKSNGQIAAEDTFLVLNVLVKWLSNIWNKSKGICTDQECLIDLFLDQDDQLLEMMICNLNIYTYLQTVHRVGISSEAEVMQTFNPHMQFLHFIQQLDYDYSLLLDLLISNETCTLHYLLQYLKLINFEWHNFIQAHQLMSEKSQINFHSLLSKCSDKRARKELHTNQSFNKMNNADESIASSSKSINIMKNSWAPSVHATVGMLMQLCSTIQSLLDKGLFPYNARPLIRILNDCEKLYNCNKIV